MDYPFLKCLEPKRIVNPYTHESMLVPCGTCKSCVCNRNSRYALLCDLESTSHKYCVFVTLTYANRFIPRAVFVPSSDELCCMNLFDKETGELLSDTLFRESDCELLLKKFHLFGDVPYLRKSDLQKFIKRFRYYASQRSSEKVRYFAIGEYGPVHFRPHYHILFYFSDKALLQACEQIVRESWEFGRIDCQLSEGKCSSYVAGYVNSSFLVPEVFKARALAPFCVHSQRLGCRFLKSELKKVYETSVEDFIRKSCVINGKYTEFNVWRSYYAYFFPKCKGFANKSSRLRLESYRVYDYARDAFPEAENLLDLARTVAQFCCEFHGHFSDFTFTAHCTDQRYVFLDNYFYDSSVKIDTIEYDRYVHRIYTDLSVSRHFLYTICDHHTVVEQKRKLSLIEDFYKRLDYLHLRSFFESQQLFYESDMLGSQDDDPSSDGYFYPYFYDNVGWSISKFKRTPCYRQFNDQINDLFRRRIKHKQLNDLNKIFFD